MRPGQRLMAVGCILVGGLSLGYYLLRSFMETPHILDLIVINDRLM